MGRGSRPFPKLLQDELRDSLDLALVDSKLLEV